MTLASTPEIIAELKAGRMVILVDEEDRENEGDLVLAADFVTPEAINFMARFGRGLVCLTLTQDRCRQLNLPLMTHRNGTQYGTAFTLSIEAAEGVTTGISAADRARTIQTAVKQGVRAEEIVQPGHVFPIMAQPGGVLVRAGHTEAGCDLTSMAGLTPAAVICEIIKDDGTMARLPDLIEFGKEHGLKIGTIADLIAYRSQHETMITRVGERTMETAHGTFNAVMYQDKPSGSVHIALVRGKPQRDVNTPVRVHEPLSALDLLETGATTHSWTVDAAMKEIAARDLGVLVMLNCDGGSADHLIELFKALDEQERAAVLKRRPVNFRTFGIGSQILQDVGVGRMQVLASPRKLPSLSGYGLEITEFIAMPGGNATSA